MTRKNAITEVRIRREPCPVQQHFFGLYALERAAAAGIDTRGLVPHPLPEQPTPQPRAG